jgi:hypothetical protein
MTLYLAMYDGIGYGLLFFLKQEAVLERHYNF